MEIGDVVVHRSLGNQPLVVIGVNASAVEVRYANQSQNGLEFTSQIFFPAEVETPEESIIREAELFQVLAAKKKELNEAESGYKNGPRVVN